MRIIRSIDDYRAETDIVLSIGVFDGVHLGHRAVLRSLIEQKNATTLAAALTFDHHPQAFLQPGSAPKSITTTDEKINLLDECGLDVLFLLTFDQRIAGLAPEVFLQDVLLEKLRTKLLVVGENWRYGKGRAGDCDLARRVLEPRGCRFEAASLLEQDGEKISSSRIRTLIEERRFDEADRMLGSPYTLRGMVTYGDGRGHVLGFPTANLNTAAEKLVPPDGVYGGVARHDGRDYTAVVSIGTKPTFGGTASVVEAYLLGFAGSIYGDQVALRQWTYVRDQVRYDGADALVRQMHMDVAAVTTRRT